MDPCAVLSVLGKDKTGLKVVTGTRPYFCEFTFDVDDQYATQSMVSTQKTLEQLEWAKKKGDVIEINGAHARKDGSGSHCKFDLYLDETHPAVRDLTGDGGEAWVDVVEMDGNYGCTELQKTAAAIVDVYRRAKRATAE